MAVHTVRYENESSVFWLTAAHGENGTGLPAALPGPGTTAEVKFFCADAELCRHAQTPPAHRPAISVPLQDFFLRDMAGFLRAVYFHLSSLFPFPCLSFGRNLLSGPSR